MRNLLQIKDSIRDFLRNHKKLPFVACAIIMIAYPIVNHFWGEQMTGTPWAINHFLLLIITFALIIISGVLLLKSLFIVAAELSLLIFLGQSYCSATSHAMKNDAALIFILISSSLYIVIKLFSSLFKSSKDFFDFKSGTTFEKFCIISFLLTCIGFFIQQIYFIIQPIILDLCIFKR